MEQYRTEFEHIDSQIIAVAVQTQAEAADSVEASEARYPILADSEHTVVELYGVYDADSGKATPSVFIINQDGEIVWVYISSDIADRPSPELILRNMP